MAEYIGEFEHLVLLAVLRLGEDAYGVTVRRELQIRARREISLGAVYATLDRLQAKGLVRSFAGAPTPERGGRAKRMFEITPRGVAAVHRVHSTLRRMARGLKLAGELP